MRFREAYAWGVYSIIRSYKSVDLIEYDRIIRILWRWNIEDGSDEAGSLGMDSEEEGVDWVGSVLPISEEDGSADGNDTTALSQEARIKIPIITVTKSTNISFFIIFSSVNTTLFYILLKTQI